MVPLIPGTDVAVLQAPYALWLILIALNKGQDWTLCKLGTTLCLGTFDSTLTFRRRHVLQPLDPYGTPPIFDVD